MYMDLSVVSFIDRLRSKGLFKMYLVDTLKSAQTYI